MENFQIIICAVDSFLKEMQQIGIIKEYSLPTQKTNENVKEFKTAFDKFTQDVNSAMKCEEKEKCSEDIDVENVHLPSEDNQTSVSDTKKSLVQLQVDEDEIKRRISAFVSRKRKEVDEWNVQEFCSRPYVDEQNPVWEQMDSCARVDAVFIPRFGSKSHVKVSKVENRWGPQTQFRNEPAKRVKSEPGTETTNDVTFEVMQERLMSMEAHLNLKAEGAVRNSLFQRLKQLEDRILYLEGISPDYLHLSSPGYTSPKRKNVHEKEKAYSNWSLDDLQKRIKSVKESLKAKSAVKKEVSS